MTMGVAQCLLLKENCKVLITKFKPGYEWVITNLIRFRFN